MNINEFGIQIPDLLWVEKEMNRLFVAGLFLLPYKVGPKYNEPDLRNANVISSGWQNDRVKPDSPGTFVWGGRLVYPKKDKFLEKLLLLEIRPPRQSPRRSANQILLHYVATPPGRPGNIATIVVDKEGNVVPNVHTPFEGKVKVLFLKLDWKNMGWFDAFPVIAFQFLDGVCESSPWAIAKFQDELLKSTE